MEIESLITARWLLSVDEKNTVLENHALAINDGQIIDILPTTLAETRYQATETLHLPHHIISPGFVNAHTHSPMALLKGLADDLPLMEWLEQHIWPAEGQWVDDQFTYDGSRLAIAEMLRSGTTCFNDMYFFAEGTARAVDEAGIRACLGLILIDFPTRYAQNPDEYLKKGLALHDQLADKPLITTAFAPHAPYTVSDEPLTTMLHLACELDIPIHMHVHETAFEVTQAEQRPLARLNDLKLLDKRFLAVHMTQLNDTDIQTVAEKNTHVVHCPESNMKLASGFCPAAKLLDAGVNVALGTDGNASNNDLDMLGEMRSAAMIGKAVAGDASALSATEVLRMATINGAKALGLQEQIGSLEVGKAADIIAIDMNALETQPLYDPVSHLVYCANRNQISHVWVAGRCLLRERNLTTLDKTAIIAAAKNWQEKIAAQP